MAKEGKPKKLKIISYRYEYDKDHPIQCEICGKITPIYHKIEFSDGTKDTVCPECYLLNDKYPKSKKYLQVTDVARYMTIGSIKAF